MKGLRDLDFQMWNPDHVVAAARFAKPATGNVLSLVDPSTLTADAKFLLVRGAGGLSGQEVPSLPCNCRWWKNSTASRCRRNVKRLLPPEGTVYRQESTGAWPVLGRASDAVSDAAEGSARRYGIP